MPKVKQLIMGSQGGGMGDNLQITPIFKYFYNSTIEIINNDYGRDLASLYDGLANIQFKDNPIKQEESFKLYGYPERSLWSNNAAFNYLSIFGIEKLVSPIPFIKLNLSKLQKSKQKLSVYKNPIVVVTYGRGINTINDDHARYRLPSYENWQFLINKLSEKYTVLHYSKEQPLIKFNNCIEINGLTIDELKHDFTVISKYVGVDTGSYHLMIAVGGFTHVIVPKLSWEHQYYPPNWQYPPELWWNEPVRVKYYNKDCECLKILDNV